MLDAPPLCAAGDQSNELGLPPLAGTSVEHGLLNDHVVHATVTGVKCRINPRPANTVNREFFEVIAPENDFLTIHSSILNTIFFWKQHNSLQVVQCMQSVV